MMHNRKYVPGYVDIVKGRIRNLGKTGLKDFIEKLIIDSGILEAAPFKWVSLIYGFGLQNNTKPKFRRINKQYGDLPLTIELKMEVLEAADKISVELLSQILLIGALEALLDVGRKYKLPTEVFAAERAKYGDIPETKEEVAALGPNGLLKG